MASAALADKRLWIAGGGLVAVIAIAFSWLMFISPALDSASSLRAQTRDENFSNSLAEAQNAHLAALNRNLTDLQSTLTSRLAALPPDSGLPAFTTEVSTVASANKVALAGLVVGTVGPVSPAGSTGTSGTPAPSATTTASTSGSSGTSSGTTGATGTTASASDAASIYSIAITLQSSGRLSRQLAFLKALETGARHLVIGSTQLTTSAGSRVASIDTATQMTTQLTVFSAPMTPAQLTQLKKLLSSGH